MANRIKNIDQIVTSDSKVFDVNKSGVSYTDQPADGEKLVWSDDRQAWAPESQKDISGEAVFTTAGTYSWVVPDGVSSICAVCVGGGGGKGAFGGEVGAGGALGWKNEIPVTAGETLTIEVGAGGSGGTTFKNGSSGGKSCIWRGEKDTGVGLVGASGGSTTRSVHYLGAQPLFDSNGGGGGYAAPFASHEISNGYCAWVSGGGGAGGYMGNGGNSGYNADAGSGGGSGGAYRRTTSYVVSGSGGGVGLYGLGADGASLGQGGSGGTDGSPAGGATVDYIEGGTYGGGCGSCWHSGVSYGQNRGGGKGAIRIFWGGGRSFPNNAA